MTVHQMSSPRLFAGIDIGTLTCRLLIAEITPSGTLRERHADRRILRLGQGVDRDRTLRTDAVERVVETLREWRTVMDGYEFLIEKAFASRSVLI